MFRSKYFGSYERLIREWEPPPQPPPLPPRMPQEYDPYFSPRKWNRGRIRWFNVTEHSGCIVADFRNLEVYFHQSNVYGILPEQLYPDLPVWFQIRPSVRGLEGYNIQPAVELREFASTSRTVWPEPIVGRPSLGIGQELIGARRLPERRRIRRFRCYNCGQYASHKAATCPYEPMRRRCYRCRDPNHLIAQCPLLHPQIQHHYSLPGPSTMQVPLQFPGPRSQIPQPSLRTVQQQLPQQPQQPFMQYFFPPGFDDDDDVTGEF
ncbi:Protein lin-28 [Schistosoma japonicum]|uniref:Protein lin-28 n=1 Tax=Schistosoma japonicum TaxID=6182 RepID=A0A4Z2DY02_SCHJA|nr:Protein lin-28 [Schistosoma japonicum]KAH8874398.1 Protein lin-28 [Schistosoma japonicum]TNN21120.1 Protein lin-28 [Schistosoma japonicum]